ncbi:Derl-like family member protein [Theileria equi strain WA]|uniref:Derlin n=1 Tax=Theileria equi strain WA TaxID=1537102 RepID=L0B167_THEEQ|nr:Derl-like family member protein [Theileria equi strain WA]AFZ81607.1 Derl-like family member protein [Theileria equi strain WA]|eukprot:XP_004831273.1 Derl-like family member protein [Theileria equi strain WA]
MNTSRIEKWYLGLPRITRTYITILFIVTLSSVFKILDPSTLLLDWNLITKKYEIWRIVTNCFYIGPFSLGWFFFISAFTKFSTSLETDPSFSRSPGQYLYFIFIQTVFLSTISILFFWPSGLPFLGNSLLFAIIYYWSKKDMWSHVSIYFVTVKGYQLPFAMLFLHIIMGSSIWIDLIGLISSHIYYLIRDVIPHKGFPNILSITPSIFDTCAKKVDLFYKFLIPDNTRSNYTNNYSRATYIGTTSSGFIGRGVRLGDS